ncbi:MAG: hypothetical protein Q4E94_05820, partial [Clostridia bacterium]|nr:hypothetical protein [Clostridia bacterium]
QTPPDTIDKKCMRKSQHFTAYESIVVKTRKRHDSDFISCKEPFSFLPRTMPLAMATIQTINLSLFAAVSDRE